MTASQTEDRGFPRFDHARAVSENTPMAVMMTRRWVYDALVVKDGYFFDEGFFNYASDCDLALRLAACGIRGVQLDMQYYHYGSASHRLAPPESGAAQRTRRTPTVFTSRRSGDSALTLSNMDSDQQTQTFADRVTILIHPCNIPIALKIEDSRGRLKS